MRHISWALALFFFALPVTAQQFSHGLTGDVTPWTSEQFAVREGDFTFVLHADLTGGERPGIFETAAHQMALLRPEFVISVGDLIEGGGNREELIAEWEDFDRRAALIGAPVFYVGGNHDLSSELEREIWAERYGLPYYYFIYENVLFLVLDTEDMTAERRQLIATQRAEAVEIYKTDGPEAFAETPYAQSTERATGAISLEQGDYFVDVVTANPDVRHTFVITHKPAWEAEETEFHRIETALEGRSYTVFNGHEHFYEHHERYGQDHIQLATTGGEQFPDLGLSEDHITLVTVSRSEVSILNLMLAGIRDKTGSIPHNGKELCFATAECGAEN